MYRSKVVLIIQNKQIAIEFGESLSPLSKESPTLISLNSTARTFTQLKNFSSLIRKIAVV